MQTHIYKNQYNINADSFNFIISGMELPLNIFELVRDEDNLPDLEKLMFVTTCFSI